MRSRRDQTALLSSSGQELRDQLSVAWQHFLEHHQLSSTAPHRHLEYKMEPWQIFRAAFKYVYIDINDKRRQPRIAQV